MCPYWQEKRLAFRFCHRIKISQKQRSTALLGIWLWHLLWKIKIMEQWKIGFDIYFIFIQGHELENPFLYFISISGRHFGSICTPKSLLFYRIHIKKLNLSLKWTKYCLNSVTDTLTNLSYRMEGIISMQFGINGRLWGFLGLFSIDPYEQDLTCVFHEIDGVIIQKSLLKWQVAKQSATNKCQKLLFYDMGAF